MKPSLTRNKRYKQGVFKPRNPHKYIGNPTNIIWRSSWEHQFLKFCDLNPSIVQYNSEEVVIPYISPIDNKQHRYFVDFFILVKQRDGTTKKCLIEIKPYAQTRVPKARKNMLQEQFNEQMKTYYVNQAKWQSAKQYAALRGMEFYVLTEKELFKNAKRKTK